MAVLSRWMQDGFSYCHSNPIIWEQHPDLLVRQYHYGGREASTSHTGDFQSLLLNTKSWGADESRKTSHIFIQEIKDIIYILNSMESPRLRDPLNRSTCKIEKTRTAPPGSKLMEWRCLEDKPRNLFDIYNFQNSASATFPREIYTHRTKIQSRK
jgi:hypothetical protein